MSIKVSSTLLALAWLASGHLYAQVTAPATPPGMAVASTSAGATPLSVDLGQALRASALKILIFLSVVLMAVLLLGTTMYVIEGPENGYTSIPISVYWAIVTMTTVGYGDLTPHTDLGKLVASMMMLIGWGILAVPTGIVTAEMTARRFVRPPTTRICHECMSEGHEADAAFCKDCGTRLPAYEHD